MHGRTGQLCAGPRIPGGEAVAVGVGVGEVVVRVWDTGVGDADNAECSSK